MKYTIYKTTNLINNKFYIGYHKTENPNDSYLGSGKLLLKAIKKHGKENFKKEILFVFDNKEEALKKERILVNESIVKDKNSYNSKLGGEGGWDYIFEKLKNDPDYKIKYSERASRANKKSYKSGKRVGWQAVNKKPDYKNPMEGKKHTNESKRKISKNNGNRLSKKEIQRRISLIENSNIDFNKLGWIGKVCKLIGTSKGKLFVEKYCPDIYKNSYKRKI